ncbi:MAG: adenylate/guanylate cyclase domain-containing protein [Pseudomonadota bacterium]
MHADIAIQTERELCCVVFADVAGYSALTSRDEAGTHAMLMAFVRDVVEPMARSLNGDIVRTLGDGMLLTFQSGSSAIKWALGVQEKVREGRSGKAAPYSGLSLRIAVHISEIIRDEGDIYGDGVNITKRLQDSIAADGIIISEDIYHATRKSIPLEVRNLGYLTLKNISDPIRAFEIIQTRSGASVGLTQAKAELPSIAILPLQNLGGDDAFNYFADGVVEDIIVSLSSLKELLVISRASTLALGAGAVDPREVGRILDVRYVLMGSIRRSATKIRLSVTLCDTNTAEVIFSKKSEFPHSDLFDAQDKIAEHIVALIAPNVRVSERSKALRKPPGNFTAYDLTLKALDQMTVLTKESYDEALLNLQQAMEMDEEFAMPVAYAARWHCIYVGQGWDSDRSFYVGNAKEYASRAVQLDRTNALGLAAYGHVKSYLERDYDTALIFLDRARDMGPSHAIAWVLSSGTLCYVGRAEEAVEHAMHGLRLSPNDPDAFQYYDFLCMAYYLNRQFDRAVEWGERSFAEKSDYTSNWRLMAVANAGAGKIERAEEFAKKIMERDPEFRIDPFMENFCPFRERNDREMYSGHLRAAGLQ